MTEHRGLISSGWAILSRNKRYIFWFYVLNLTLAEFGAAAFRNQAHAILDHSLLAQRLVNGFDVSVYLEMIARPEFGPSAASSMSAVYFAVLFFVATALFIPGVLQGYACSYRLPREEFFRACGRNLWRFVRLMIVAGIAMGAVAGILFGVRGALIKAAGESTNELLPVYVSMAGLLIIFLVMSSLRIWFDIAEADVVLSDQRAVRRSVAKAFRHTWRGLGRLLGSYVVATILAAIFLVGGLWVWLKFVAPASVLGAMVVSQLTLLLLLIPRFWQRGIAVSYYKQHMVEPIAEQSFAAAPAPPSVSEPAAVSAVAPAPTTP